MKHFVAIFPGQGSQHQGMGKELYDNFKVAQRTFEEASDALKLDLKRLCFDTPDTELKLTFNTQPALLVTSMAAWQVFESECGVKPQSALGHSLGEYSALVAAEGISLGDAIQTVRIRGQAMQDAVPVGTGSMVAIMGLDDSSVIKACHDMQELARTDGGLKDCVIEAANFNCPGQVVVSGHQKALDYLKANLKAENYGGSRLKILPLAVSAPFHSSLMKPAAERLKTQLEKVKWNPKMAFDVIHNVSSETNRDGLRVKDLLFAQMTKPVLWTSSVHRASALGAQHFVEFGAGRVLSGLVKKIAHDAHTLNVDTIENLKKTISELNA